MGGYKKIKPEEGKQFSKDYQPANRGRKPSIKNQLKEILQAGGKMLIDAKDVAQINEDGSVLVKVPTEMKLALKLQKIALGDTNNTLKAIQIIMEQLDGKPKQAFSFDEGEEILPTRYTIIRKEDVKK